MDGFYEGLDALVWALDDGLDAGVPEVYDVAPEPVADRQTVDEGAEAHALHPAGHVDLGLDAARGVQADSQL